MDEASNTNSHPGLLCLNCREEGHGVADCPCQLGSKFSLQGFAHSSERAHLVRNALASQPSGLCSRCRNLNILDMFSGDLSWQNPSIAVDSSTYCHSPHHRTLGRVDEVKFYKSCGLCVALFCLVPSPYNHGHSIHILTDYTIHRLERLVQVNAHPEHVYDKCIIADLLAEGDPFRIDEHEGDALTLLRPSEDTLPCGGQLVNTTINLDLIRSYFHECEQSHGLTCLPKVSESLSRTKMIDIQTRTLVDYPGRGCEYITLSYVWGNIMQPRPNADQTILEMPATIEDAIKLTGDLGMRYLWVDSVCINQDNEKEKLEQIHLIADIYRGAYATILSLCGTSCADGLSRLNDTDERLNVQPQLSCTIDGARLIGLMPTLSRQISYNVWGNRAWTLQEALLSPRNIYVTNHQVYFECNSMQCSESIDITKSWIHNTLRDTNMLKNNSGGSVFGHGTLRNAPIGIDKPGCMLAYGTLIGLYSYRRMTYQEDALHAFTAILQHLKELAFERGFCFGLPEDDLDWSLLWCGLYGLNRRHGFPAWSWAGWEGGIQPGWPTNVYSIAQRDYTHFHAWICRGRSLRKVFPHQISQAAQHGKHTLFPRPTIFDTDEEPNIPSALEEICISAGPAAGYLLLDCLVMSATFIPRSQASSFDYGPFQHYTVHLNGVVCLIRLPRGQLVGPDHDDDEDETTKERLDVSDNTDKALNTKDRANHEAGLDVNVEDGPNEESDLDWYEYGTYVLTGRDKFETGDTTYIVHHFLDVDIEENGKAMRCGVMNLFVPENQPEALEGLEVMRRSLILV